MKKFELKNYFQIGIGVGLLIALIGMFVWFKNGYSNPKPEGTEVTEDAESGPDARFDEDLAARNAEATPAPELKNEPAVDLAKASENFAQGMKQLATCIQINSGPSSDKIEPTYENLISTVRNDLGEPILHSEDWVVWNIKTSDGEERRIRIETDYSDSDQTSRHLRYFKVDHQGVPSIIPLPPDQTKDPSEAFIATLQKDGDMYQEEKGERAYFENGQELVLTERDGRVNDFEFSNGTKTFRCTSLMSQNPACKCY